MLEMTSAEREYRQKLEVGETVSTLLHANEHLSEESLMDKYRKPLKLYRQSQVQHMPVYKHATLKPWQKIVFDMIDHPSDRTLILIIGIEGNEGKTFLQKYIKQIYGTRHVLKTELNARKSDVAYMLSQTSLTCKDIFLFNLLRSDAEVAYG